MSQPRRGNFVWYQLNAVDPGVAKAFYCRVAGWQAQDMDLGGQQASMFARDGAPLASLMQIPADAIAGGARSHWLAYVSSPDLDCTCREAKDAGAKVMVEPTEIPTVGRFAVLADPQGAMFAAFTPAPGSAAPETSHEVGQFTWHELATTEPGPALGFYSKLFGWKAGTAHEMGPDGTYQEFENGAAPLGGVFLKPSEMPGPPSWLLYVRVAEIAPALERVKELGGQVLNGPMEVPGGSHVAQCLDPQGAAFAVHQI